MNLKLRILEDMRLAMQNGDQHRRRVTRMLLSEISYAETTSHRAGGIDESVAQNMIVRYHEQLLKSLEFQPEGEKKQELLRYLDTVAQYLPHDTDPGDYCQAI